LNDCPGPKKQIATDCLLARGSLLGPRTDLFNADQVIDYKKQRSRKIPRTDLEQLARRGGARTIIEFGTSFGISTLYLAAALRDNGGGHLITTEFEPSKVARARHNLAAGGLNDLVEIREGDALQTLSAGLPPMIDLVLLDGAKALYPEILNLVESRLRPGAFIVADNADDSPDYHARVRSLTNGYMSTPFAEDVELSMRIS
jgi:predicted O-methyltransferase YrrM